MSISTEITRITNARDDAFTSIGNKGVSVPSSSVIDDMADLIDDIDAVTEWPFVPSQKESNIVKVGDAFYAWRVNSSASPSAGNACAEVPIAFDYNVGYVTNGTWNYQDPTLSYSDIYQLHSGHNYFIVLGYTAGTRFNAMITMTDVRGSTSDVSGTKISTDTENPAGWSTKAFLSNMPGYLIITKDNMGTSGIRTYVYDRSANWQ